MSNWALSDSDDDYYIAPAPAATVVAPQAAADDTNRDDDDDDGDDAADDDDQSSPTPTPPGPSNTDPAPLSVPRLTPRSTNSSSSSSNTRDHSTTPSSHNATTPRKTGAKKFPTYGEFSFYYLGPEKSSATVAHTLSTTCGGANPLISHMPQTYWPRKILELEWTKDYPKDYAFSLTFPTLEHLAIFYNAFLELDEAPFTLIFTTIAVQRLYNQSQNPHQTITAPTTPSHKSYQSSSPFASAPSEPAQSTPTVSGGNAPRDEYITKDHGVQIRSRDDILRERAEKEAEERRLAQEKRKDERRGQDGAGRERSDRKLGQSDELANLRSKSTAPHSQTDADATSRCGNVSRGGRGGAPGGARRQPSHGHVFTSDDDALEGDESNTNPTKSTLPKSQSVSASDSTRKPTGDADRAANNGSYGRGKGGGSLRRQPSTRSQDPNSTQTIPTDGEQSTTRSRYGSQQPSRRSHSKAGDDDLAHEMAVMSLEEGQSAPNQQSQRLRRSNTARETREGGADVAGEDGANNPTQLKPVRSAMKKTNNNDEDRAQNRVSIAGNVVIKVDDDGKKKGRSGDDVALSERSSSSTRKPNNVSFAPNDQEPTPSKRDKAVKDRSPKEQGKGQKEKEKSLQQQPQQPKQAKLTKTLSSVSSNSFAGLDDSDDDE